MKNLLAFLGTFAFITQAHCHIKDEFLTVENDSNQKISVAPVMKMGDLYQSKGIEIAPNQTQVFKLSDLVSEVNLEEVAVAGFTISLEGTPEKFYEKSKFPGKVRFTETNLQKFFGRN